MVALLHARIVGMCPFGPANWWWIDWQWVIDNGWSTMSVTAPFLHPSADKDTVSKNIIHHCCISSCLEEIRSVQKWMSNLGVSIVLLFFSFLTFFYRVLNHNNGHMVTCLVFSSFIFADKVALDSANYFKNNVNNSNLVI